MWSSSKMASSSKKSSNKQSSSKAKLPPEVLDTIFSNSIEIHDNVTSGQTNEWPLPLLRVNKEFEAVALANPDLWKKHRVLLSRRLSEREADKLIENHAKLMAQCWRANLSVEISCESRSTSPKAVSRLLVPNSSRITNLILNYVYFRCLDALIDPNGACVPFPNLTSLEINIEGFRTDEAWVAYLQRAKLFNSRVLKTLSLYSWSTAFGMIFYRENAFPWQQLTTLNLGYVSVVGLREILLWCRNLQNFRAFNCDGPSNLVEDKEPSLRLKEVKIEQHVPPILSLKGLPIRWNRLTKLIIWDLKLNVNKAVNMLKECPRLKHLEVGIFAPRDSYGGISVVQLDYLEHLCLDLYEGTLLTALKVPNVEWLQINNLPQREVSDFSPEFPIPHLIHMLGQSGNGYVKNMLRRRRSYYNEGGGDWGPREPIIFDPNYIEHFLGLMNNAVDFGMTGLVIPTHCLHRMMANTLLVCPYQLDFAVTPQDVDLTMALLRQRFKEDHLRKAHVMVLPGYPKHQLKKLNRELERMTRKHMEETEYVFFDCEEYLRGPPIPNYDVDSSDSSSASSKSSGYASTGYGSDWGLTM